MEERKLNKYTYLVAFTDSEVRVLVLARNRNAAQQKLDRIISRDLTRNEGVANTDLIRIEEV